MDERQDRRAGEQQDDLQYRRRKPTGGPGYVWAGLFLLLVGGILLLDQMGFPLPDWLFSWHILLVAIGLFLGLRHNFRGGAWLILILIGGSFLVQDFYPKMELRRFIGPCALIFIGFIILVRPKSRWRNHAWKEEWRDHMHQKWRNHEWQKRQGRWMPPGGFGGPNSFNNAGGYNPGGYSQGPQQDPTPNSETSPGNQSAPGGATNPTSASGGSGSATGSSSSPGPASASAPNNASGPNAGATGSTGPTPQSASSQGSSTSQTGGAFANSSNHSNYSSEDFIDTTSIFGGVHKKVVSKNFKGGDIVTFLGGSEIDLSQAEIVGTARLDVTQVMGGTKIIVPAHWEVRSEVTALFAGFEDKRQQPAMINPDKVLIIDGTSIFGGIELKNY